MLGLAQVSPQDVFRTASWAWYPSRPGQLGFGGALVRPVDPSEVEREKLIERFHRAEEASGPSRKGLSGTVITFKGRPPQEKSQRRSREIAWRRLHEPQLRVLQSQWVVVEGEELIAHGEDAAQVVAQARNRGIKVPYVFFVEPIRPKTARLGI